MKPIVVDTDLKTAHAIITRDGYIVPLRPATHEVRLVIMCSRTAPLLEQRDAVAFLTSIMSAHIPMEREGAK